MLGFRKQKNKIFIFLVVLLFFILLIGIQDWLKNVFYSLSQTGEQGFFVSGKTIFSFFNSFLNYGKTKQENNRLLNENKELKARISFLQEKEKENELLRQALDLELEKKFKLLEADVTLRNASEDFVVLNKGEKHGVKQGMVVIGIQGFLLGKIDKVYPNFSEVVLISKKGNVFPLRLEQGDLVVKARGAGNLRIFLDPIEREKEIKIGDMVSTVALEGLYPKGLFVGEVKGIEDSDLTPYQKAEVDPAFNLENLEMVFIVLD
jgi:rod shape-determining protein MreC